jgi:hypothetical protein
MHAKVSELLPLYPKARVQLSKEYWETPSILDEVHLALDWAKSARSRKEKLMNVSNFSTLNV